ncbi:MAG TPA: hypothetical protein VMZ53_07290 [Kofleriaceae bacterium]|nr:hypothetical protein [Kofleriaceae bacterium]
MRIMALVVLLVAACGSKKSDNAAPKGAKVIEWDATKSSRATYKTATFDNRVTRDDIISVKACADEIKLKLHVDTATAKYTEDGKPVEIVALASLTATVEDGKGFELTNGACDGPNYQLTAPGEPPGYTILDCHFKAKKPNNDCAPMFQLKGDGTLLTN